MKRQLGFTALLISCVLIVHTTLPAEDASWDCYKRMKEDTTYILAMKILECIPDNLSADPVWQAADDANTITERRKEQSWRPEAYRQHEANGVKLLSQLIQKWVEKSLHGLYVKDYFNALSDEDKKALRIVKAKWFDIENWQDRENDARGDMQVWNDLIKMHTPTSVIYARNIAKGCGIVALLYGVYRLNEYRRSRKVSPASEQKS